MKRTILILSIITTILFADKTIVNKYLNNIEIANPIEYKNLTLFPILYKLSPISDDCITLDEAVDKNWLKIKEVGAGEVNFVEMKNNGYKMIFIMTGEIISGAKQDRMLKKDILIPPQSSWIRVPVFCVEHGRWASICPEFKSARLLVPNALRQKAKLSDSQSEVWNEIAVSQDRLGIASATDALKESYYDEEIKAKIDDYTQRLEKVPKISKSCIGVIVTTGDKIICFDMFADNNLLNKFWGKLIRSYAMDALIGEKGRVDRSNIKNFIITIKNANYVSTGTPGLGQLFECALNHGKGSALVYKSAVIHMDFFPANNLIDDDYLRLDFRRHERLED